MPNGRTEPLDPFQAFADEGIDTLMFSASLELLSSIKIRVKQRRRRKSIGNIKLDSVEQRRRRSRGNI
jgi:hypothetical protein